MTRGCTPGLAHRWTFYCWPDLDADVPIAEAPRKVPEEGDIGIVAATGSCYLVTSIKRSRVKAPGWYTIHVEGLGVDVASIEDEGTFGLGHLDHQDHETIRYIEQAERAEAGKV